MSGDHIHGSNSNYQIPNPKQIPMTKCLKHRNEAYGRFMILNIGILVII
jgi:hypothetical protein